MLDKYVGVYSSPETPIKWTIARDGETLFFQPPGAQSGVPLEAAAEFRKITEHRGYEILSPLSPLAHLGIARAMALTGNTDASKKAYEAFLTLWQEADANLPIFKEARREAAQFQ